MTVRKIIAQKPGEREGCQEGEHSQPCRSGTLRQYSGVVGTDAACSLVSLRDAVGSISALGATAEALWPRARPSGEGSTFFAPACESRSEEHTSELQSRLHLVCRLLLEKKKK